MQGISGSGKMKATSSVRGVGNEHENEGICDRIVRHFLSLLGRNQPQDVKCVEKISFENPESEQKIIEMAPNYDDEETEIDAFIHQESRKHRTLAATSGMNSAFEKSAENKKNTVKMRRSENENKRGSGSADDGMAAKPPRRRGSAKTGKSYENAAKMRRGNSNRRRVCDDHGISANSHKRDYDTREYRNFTEEQVNKEEDDDPVLQKLKKVHESIKKSNEQRQRNIFEFQSSIRSRIEQGYNEGGVRMAEYLLRRRVVEKGLCIVWTGGDTTRISDLTNTYSQLGFEVAVDTGKKPTNRENVGVEVFDFIIWHTTFPVSKKRDNRFLGWLINEQPIIKRTPKVVFLQKAHGFVEITGDVELPETLIIRTDIENYVEAYLRALQVHGTSVDIQTILKIVENETLKEGFTITTNGTISEKIFFRED